MKKIIALLLALTLALSLAACGSTDQTPSSGEPESSLTSDTNSDQEMESTTEPEGSTQEPEVPAEDAEGTDAEKPAENTGSNTGSSKPTGGTSTGSSNTSKPSGGNSSSGGSGSTGTSKPSEPEKPAETEKSLTDLMTSILSGVETPGYAITELAAEQYPLYLFIDQPEGAQAVTADSLIGSIAHSVVLMRLPDGADVSGIAKQVKDNADPRKWICVEAEKVIVKTKGNLVLLVMSTTDIADAIAANFDALSV